MMDSAVGHGLALFLEKKHVCVQPTGALPAKDVIIFKQNQLYNLVLVNHMDGHVAGLCLGPQEGRAKHNGHALSCHPVRLSMFYHSKRKIKN